MLGYIYIPGINENAYFDKDGFVVETSSDTVPGVPCIDGISCDKVVLYEKLPIKQTMLEDILELTQGLKRQEPCAGFCGLWCAKCTGSQVW